MTASNKKLLYMAAIAALVLVTSAIIVPLSTSEEQKNKNHKEKPDQFTRHISETFVEQSGPHNAEGHSAHQALYFVYPQEGKNYHGSLTFTTTKSIDILVYHDITGSNTTGLTIHKVDGRSYAVTPLLKNVTSATVDFVGAGILAHSASSDQYTVVASVEAWGWNNQNYQPGNSTG